MSTPDPLLGQQLSNYLIQEALGQGGMARVYKGFDVSLKRPVAVKVIGERLRQSEFYAQRFEHEAQAVANLRHLNIVSVYYFGNQDSIYFLVMEYVDGTDLEAILLNYANNRELMPYADVMRILEAIASGLDYAHEQGVIHRDIKPSNIMVERSRRPVLTDFGLALRLSEGTVGNTFGTPHYISPEQAQSSANVVPQSDLYSLAVIAYEMLAGTVPFDDPSPTALAMQHIIAAVPSPRYFNPKLSEEVEQVLIKALSKEPDERYGTGAEFAGALRRSLEAMLRSPSAIDMHFDPPSTEEQRLRQISMQTVVDKVEQELAMQEAKGQTITRSAEMGERSPALRSVVKSLLPYIVAISIALLALVIIMLVLSATTNTPTTDSLVVAATTSPSPVPLTETQIPPSATALPPTPTILPPTENVIVAPSSTLSTTNTPSVSMEVSPVPPTYTPVASDVPPGATLAPPDWLPVRFIYNNDSFYWMNDANRSINARPIVFERIGGGERFEGQWWAYWTMEAGRCMEIAFADIRSPQRPTGCRPNAFYTPTRSQDTNFWTGSGAFRVLWNGAEITICEIVVGQCVASVPPT